MPRETFDVTNRSGQILDPVLTNLAVEYSPKGLVADRLTPAIPVQKESGQYNVWDARNNFAVDVDPLLPDRTPAKEIAVGVSQDRYSADEYALKASISRRERENTDDLLRLREHKMNAVQFQLLLAREVRVAAMLRKTTNGGGLNLGATPSNNWNVDAGEIEVDIKLAKEAIYDASGIEPNVLVLPYKVANAVSLQSDIREILKYTVNGQQILQEGDAILPASLWGLQVIVPRGRKVTSAEGATNAFGDIWGDSPRVLYVSEMASTTEPSVAHTFQVRGWETRRWEEDDPEVEYVKTSHLVDEKVVAPDCGYEIANVLT
jgi:hypothetical protein